MTVCFADTYYFLAILNPKDKAHGKAAFARGYVGRFVTTQWILAELLDALSAPRDREKAAAFVRGVTTAPQFTVIPATQDWFGRGLSFFESRRDKQWSFTDCVSFVVMQDQAIATALTGDHHFEQAGFSMLLK